MLPVSQNVSKIVIPKPDNEGTRRDVTSFLSSMHILLSKIDWVDPHLREIQQWYHAVTMAVSGNANIHLILEESLPFLQKRLWDPLQVHTHFDRYVPPQLPARPEFNEITLRRRCSHFICDLGKELLKYNLNDPISLEIKNFHGLFLQDLHLNKENTQPVFEKFIPILQQLLMDPLGNPLEEESLMGSDGNTYGKMSLSVYLHKIPKEFRDHPPLDFGATHGFCVERHPLVSYLVKRLDSLEWKAGKSAKLISEATYVEYNVLVQQHLLPELPEGDVKEHILIQRMRAQQQAEIQNFVAFNQEVQAFLNLPIHQAVARAEQGINHMQEHVFGRLDFLTNHLRVQFEQVHEQQQKLINETEQLQIGIDALKAENATLKEAVKRTNEAVAQLQVAIKEVRAAIKKRKASAMGQLLQGVLVVGCSMFASWALSAALQSLVGTSAAGASSLGINSAGPKLIATKAADRIKVGLYAPPGY